MTGGPSTLREVDTSFTSELVRLWVRTFEEAYAGEHTPEIFKAYCNTRFAELLATAALIDPKTSCKVAFRASTPIDFTLMQHQETHYLLPETAAELK